MISDAVRNNSKGWTPEIKLFWIIDLSYYGLILYLQIFLKYGYWMAQHSLNNDTGIFIFFLNMDTWILIFYTPHVGAFPC